MRKLIAVLALLVALPALGETKVHQEVVGSVTSTGGTTARALKDHTASLYHAGDTVVNVKGPPYNAKGDGTDDRAAIQAAYDAAKASGRRLVIPKPTTFYGVSAPILIDPTYFGGVIEGEAYNAVTIKALAAMDAVIKFTDGAANSRFEIRNLTIDGNGLAQTGIYSHNITNSVFRRVLVKGTTVAAVDAGYGWYNVFEDCEFSNNTGDGLRLSVGNANATSVFRSRMQANSGWGLIVEGGPGPVNVTESGFEANRKGGIFITHGSGVANAGIFNIERNYFEGNAIDGQDFGGTVVRTDILVNATANTTALGGAYTPQVVTVAENLTTVTTSPNFGFVYFAAGGGHLRLLGNIKTPYSTQSQTLWNVWNNKNPGRVTVQGNAGFSNWNGLGPSTHDRAAPAFGSNVAIDLAAGTEFVVYANAAGAFTIDNPTNGLMSLGGPNDLFQTFTIRLRNVSGGALGAATWGTAYRLAAWTNPANGYSRAITFTYDASTGGWVEISRTPADVPN